MDSKPQDASQSGDNMINIDAIKDVDNSSSLKVVSDDETEGFSGAIESILDESTVVAVKESQLNADVDVGEDKDNDETFSEPMEFVTEKVDEVGDDAVKDKLGFVEKSVNSSEIESNSNNSNGVVKDKEDLAGETASEVVVNGVRGNTEGDSVVEEVGDEEEDDEDEDVLLVGGADDDDGNPVVDASDVKVGSEGESVVEGGDVGLSMPPVVSKVDDETLESDSAGGNDVKVTSEGDSVVEAIDVVLPLPGVAGVAVVTKTEKKAYFDEYDYRVKLLQKKQWKEEVKRMKEMKKKGNDGLTGQSYQEEEGEGDAPASVAVPLPDMVLPPSFDSDNPAYRFRFLEPTSQFLARPVLDTHGWDHDCGYDGVNVEQSLAVANRFPAAVSVQVTKDKKDFSINMDSSIAAKHNEKASSMAGFDIQPIGKQLAYIVRGETKFKNLKRNKTAAGMSVTFLGENTVTGFKVEDQLTLGRQYSIIGSAGTVRFQTDSAYGANIEVQRRELDYPIGQIQSTVGLSIIKWRGDLALGFNSLAQFSAGRNSKVAVRAGINNKMSGQITVKTSSSEYLSLALAAVIPSVLAAYKKLRPDAGERY
ncbi:putative translocase of chloroplast, membrane anchor domain-containing protein [Helianthus debilis subsp. tardiflorus]